MWEAAGECGTFGALVKTLLLTAQRKDKVTGMRWDDLTDGEWTIRSEQREKGTAGSLQLPQLALDVIEEQAHQRRLANNPYVFAGSLRGRRRANKPSGPPTFNSFSRAKRDLDAKLGDVPGWVLHDLRRTARSLLSRAGGAPGYFRTRARSRHRRRRRRLRSSPLCRREGRRVEQVGGSGRKHHCAAYGQRRGNARGAVTVRLQN